MTNVVLPLIVTKRAGKNYKRDVGTCMHVRVDKNVGIDTNKVTDANAITGRYAQDY